jgi:serine/threonine protein kinase
VKEIYNIKGLKHINVIAYFADFRTAKEICIVMELASGGLLAEVIPTNPVMERIMRILYELACALNYIHSVGVLHRDIKPENILLSSKNVVKLADFGLACAFSPSAASGARTKVGTDWYYSPEKATGKGYGAGDDVWGAGCILLELHMGSWIGHSLWSEDSNQKREQLIAALVLSLPLLGDLASGMLTKDKQERIEALEVMAQLRLALKQVGCLL